MNKQMIKTLCWLMLSLFLASCATTAGKHDGDEAEDIEIKEEYGVDDSVNEMFENAVELMKQEKYKQAIDLLKQVTEKSKKHSAPHVNMGIAYLKLGMIDESEASFNKALAINPDHPVTNNELGIVYRKSGRFDKARETYLHVIKKYPLFLPARKNMGILCDLFMKDLNCAIEHYEAYLKLNPDDEKVQIWFKDVKRRAGVK